MKFLEDINVGDTDVFGGYEVTREDVVSFAKAYDPQPFHIDDEAAKSSIFGGLCASGWHVCAMTMRMMVDHFTAKKFASLGSPGVDEIRWKRPVFPGDVLKVRAETLAVTPSRSRPQMGSVKAQYQVSNQNGDVVMEMVGIGLFARRPQTD